MTSPASSRYVVGPIYDWLFLLSPPTLALALGAALASTRASEIGFDHHGGRATYEAVGLGVVVHAHLAAVFFRSHLDGEIFRRHPVRFVVVPVLLFAGLLASEFLATLSLVVATFWDVYHSGAQTFGLGRVYDRNAGASPDVGRGLDFAMNQLIYAGPILAGVTLTEHLDEFREFESLEGPFASALASVPTTVLGHSRAIRDVVLSVGLGFVVFYLVAYARLSRRGYRISREKAFLVASTGACSLVSWGFDTWGEAFLVMNLFHAVQYLALVYARQRESLARRLQRGGLRWGQAIAPGAFVVSLVGYGLLAEFVPPDVEWFWAITMVVSLMHFWYDGFIWSVRAGAI